MLYRGYHARMNLKQGWLRTTLISLVAVAVSVVVLLGGLALWLPGFAKTKIAELIQQELGRSASLAEPKIELFSLTGPRVQIDDFKLAGQAPGTTLFSFKRLVVQASWRSITSLAPVINGIELDEPAIALARSAQGAYNIQDIIDKLASKPPSSDPTPAFSLANLVLKRGNIRFDDQAKAVVHEVKNIGLQVPFLSSLPVYQKVNVVPKLEAIIDGAPLSFDGETLPFDPAHTSLLKIKLDQVNLPRYLAYSPVVLPVKVVGAQLNTNLAVRFSQPPNQPASVQITGNATLDRVAITDRADAPVLAFEQLLLDGLQTEPMQQSLQVASIKLTKPVLKVERRSEAGGFFESVTRELAKPAAQAQASSKAASPGKPEPAAKPWRWSVASVAVIDGKVDVNDAAVAPQPLPKPLAIQASPLNLVVEGLSSEPSSRAKYQANTALGGGETIALDGTLGLNPLAVEGQAALGEVQLKNWWWVAAPHLALDASSGKLGGKITYGLKTSPAGNVLTLSNLGVQLEQVALQQTWDKKELLKLASMDLQVPGIDLAKQAVRVGAFKLQGARLLVERNRAGVLNFSSMVRKPAAGAKAQTGGTQESAAPAWAIDLDSVVIDQSAVRVRDISARGEADLDISAIQFKAERLTTRALTSTKERGRIELNARLDKAGALRVAGPVGLEPMGAQLDVDIKALPVLPAQPYFTEYVNALVSSGALSTKGRVSVEPSGIGFKGDISLADFAAVTKEANEDLLRWKSLFVGGLDLRVAPFALAINEVALADFYSRLIISPQGRFNLQDVLVKREEAAPASKEAPAVAAPSPAVTAPPPDIKVGKITLANGNIDFTDLFIRPNYSANLTSMNGGLSGLSPQTSGDLELRGKVDNAGSVEIVGKLNPLGRDLFLDLTSKARDIDLPRLTPYSAKYVGYGIEKGKLSVTLRYFIEGRKLNAENNVVLDQLTFGEKIDSPTATKLPVLFAVSLLKDRNGVIDINLPISGSLDDPQFSVAGLVWKVIGNLIVKAVTAPFSLLASLAGGSAELSNVEFAAGQSSLDEAAKARLTTLGKALADRPALRLDLAGRVAPEEDREALRGAQLQRLVKAQKLKETVAAGSNAGAIDQVQVSPQEYEKFLRLAYRQSDVPKPRNAVGQLRDLSREEMETLLLTNIKVEDSDLLNLANARAQSAKDHLVEQGKIPGERLFLTAPRLNADGIKAGSKPTQVELSLK